MKKLLLAVALLLYTSAMASSGQISSGHDRYNDLHPPQHMHKKGKRHYVKVVHSSPIYKEVITYRECRHTRMDQHRGALIGGTLGRHRLHPPKYCEQVQQRIVGYKNIAYWHGRKIVRISERPLRKILIERNERHRYAKRY